MNDTTDLRSGIFTYYKDQSYVNMSEATKNTFAKKDSVATNIFKGW